MPPGEDPDTLVRQGGAAALEPMLHDAIDLVERKIQLLERKGWFEGVDHQREAIDRLLPTIRAPRDPLMRELYLSRVAERSGIPREALEREMASSLDETDRSQRGGQRRAQLMRQHAQKKIFRAVGRFRLMPRFSAASRTPPLHPAPW